MAITVKHSKVSTIPDDADTSLVRPSDWNADHTLVGTVPVANGGTGAATLTGYVIGNGTSAMTASTTIPSGDVSGLGTMATQNANAIAVTGGTINGTIIGATTASTGAFTYLSTSGSTSTTPTLSFNGSNSPIASGATIPNSYLQFILQNKSGTSGASTNYVLSNDLGTDSTYYGEFGMNSSVYSAGTPADFFSINNGIYYSGHDGDITVGSGNGFKTYLAWGSAGQSAHVINATGSIGLNTNATGTTNYGTSGQVLTSAGNAATPTWATPTTGTVTSVSGTGTVSGISLSGTVTSSGNLTLGGTLDLSSPPAIGGTTPAAGTFTTITGQTEVLKGTGQNLLTYSQQFTNIIWNRTNGTAVDNVTTAPDGTTTAASFISNNATTGYCINATNSVVGLTYTFSVYLKPNNRTSWTLLAQSNMFSDATSRSATFTLTGSGSVASSSGSGIIAAITSIGSSWYRCSISFTTTLATTGSGIQIRDAATGDGTTGIYLWGAQFELGSTLNTYVPTTTTAVYGTPTLSFSGVAGLGLQSDGSLYVSPAGTGALQAQATTSSTVGGNARGANAVDWQTLRGSAAQVASGTGSATLGGASNTASAVYSTVAGGNQNTNTGSYSFIGGGIANTATGTAAFIGGGHTHTAAGYFNFIGAGYLNTGTASAAVTTQATTSFTSGSTAVTLSGSNANIKVGQLITGTGVTQYPHTYVAAISGTSLTLSQNASASGSPTLSFFTPHGVVVGGGNNQATGSYSFIGGGGNAGNAAQKNIASGDWSTVCGGAFNTASGMGAFIGGGGATTFSIYSNTASGTGSVLTGGGSNISGNDFSTVLGGYNVNASGAYSTAGGRYSTVRGIYGAFAYASGNTTVGGDAQYEFFVARANTTDATPTVLTTNGGAASTSNQVILPNNSAYFFRGEVISGVTGGGDTKGWTIEGVIKRGAGVGTTTLVGSTVTSLYADAGAATWTIALAADTTNGGLRVTFTGQAGTTIRVVCQLRTTEMTY